MRSLARKKLLISVLAKYSFTQPDAMDPMEESRPVERKPFSRVYKEDDQPVEEKHVENAMAAELISAGLEHLHRRVGGKEVQLFAIGGAIGTCK